MSDIVIKAENLSKRYRIGSAVANYGSLRESLAGAATAPLRRFSSLLRKGSGQDGKVFPGNNPYIWALKDVSFEIRQGDVVGIIGRNGAGKSTLLKVLSRITRPTQGKAHIRGRVGSLLEVGTGFHPELTGRENIYLNGAVLGMKRAESDRKFDEIVDFAEIEKFLDTPVKRFSSGMYMRLAFSVAAHLETEILLVDEVLAVGDATFQKKCLGKMSNIANQGRTILFVSHNMPAVKSLCQRGILINAGAIDCYGEISHCVNRYIENSTKSQNIWQSTEPKNSSVFLKSVRVVNNQGNVLASYPHDEPFKVQVDFEITSPVTNIYLALHIHDTDHTTVIFSRDFESDDEKLLSRMPGRYTYFVEIPAPLLIPGTYKISVHVAQSSPGKVIDRADYICPFEIFDNGSVYARLGYPWWGKISTPLKWECEQYESQSND